MTVSYCRRGGASLPGGPSSLAAALEQMRAGCTDCGACLTNCAFLSHYGTPGSIAAGLDNTVPPDQQLAYHCSLCGLCTALCPEGLDPCALFLALRRQYVDAGHFDPRPYRAILGYEAVGSSALLRWDGLPPGCDTVLFPGCTLPGTRPAVTVELYRRLRRLLPGLGVVLACCAKPSHDLGRMAHFEAVFGALRARLVGNGIKTVVTACPNCARIFSDYGQGLAVRTVYQVLAEHRPVQAAAAGGVAVSIHDPCPGRDDPRTQAAVRELVAGLGHPIVEMRHHGPTTLCCGEGGMAGSIAPQFARQWAERRRHQAGSRLLVTSCAGCAGRLNRVTPTVHLLDLLFPPRPGLRRLLPVARPPLTYLNRLLLKWRLGREMAPRSGNGTGRNAAR